MIRQLKQIRSFLERPDFDGFTKKDLFIKGLIGTALGQDIAALSNMAEGLSNVAEIEPTLRDDYAYMIDEIVKRSMHSKVNLLACQIYRNIFKFPRILY